MLDAIPPENVEHAEAAGLNYVSDALPGIRRKGSGKGFRYLNPDGSVVRDKSTLKRIRGIVIPPAWKDVWISTDPRGHMQATGRDIRGRKQHRYHPDWRAVRDATKYDKLVEFGQALPKIRAQVGKDLARRDHSRELILAAIVRLMDLTFIRIGNEEYTRANGSYGLTTMRDRHVKVRGDTLRFSFKGKSGKQHEVVLEDSRLARIVKKCQEIPGQELFQYYDDEGQRRDVTSGDVNAYIREAAGADFSAKDFRTWAGSFLALEALENEHEHASTGEANAAVKRAIATVAGRLGNTVAVCRKCYIHPAIVTEYLANGLQDVKNHHADTEGLREEEQILLAFLEEHRKTEGRLQEQKAALPESWRGPSWAAKPTKKAVRRRERPASASARAARRSPARGSAR